MTTTTQTARVDLASLLASVQLPALPQTAIQLLELSQDANRDLLDFARPIEADPGLMGQVLKFANSSYFSFAREITSVRQALGLVGVRTIKNFVLWSAVFSLVPDPKFGPFDLKKLWQDSLRRAVFARALGQKLRLQNSEDLFVAALLQDIAIPLLLKEMPAQYESLVERRGSEHVRLSNLEREEFGWDHAQAAASLVRNWNLPDSFATLIERHPDWNELLSASPPVLDAACVALASLLPSCQDDVWYDRDVFISGIEQLSSKSPIDLTAMLADADVKFSEFAPILKLAVPSVSLSDWYSKS